MFIGFLSFQAALMFASGAAIVYSGQIPEYTPPAAPIVIWLAICVVGMSVLLTVYRDSEVDLTAREVLVCSTMLCVLLLWPTSRAVGDAINFQRYVLEQGVPPAGHGGCAVWEKTVTTTTTCVQVLQTGADPQCNIRTKQGYVCIRREEPTPSCTEGSPSEDVVPTCIKKQVDESRR